MATVLLVSSVHAAEEYYGSPPSNHPDQVYFGDPHLHTSLSMDAGAWGNNLGLEPAYRFTRGAEVTSSSGIKQRRLGKAERAQHLNFKTGQAIAAWHGRI